MADKFKYLVMQLEVCPHSQRIHIQGYAESEKALVLSSWKKLLGDTAHIEPRRGTASEAAAYCKKTESRCPTLTTEGWDGQPFEFGTISSDKQGKRSDLEDCCKAIKEGATIAKIVEEHMPVFVKYHRGIEVAHNIHRVKVAEKR